MSDPNRPPATHAASARLIITGRGMGVHRTPTAPADLPPGAFRLGVTPSGLPLDIIATSAEWLDELIDAAQHARARLVVQGASAVAS